MAKDETVVGAGRGSRREFWIATIALAAIYPPLDIFAARIWPTMYPRISIVLVGITWFHFSVRRWHDRNQSGWWWVYGLFPLAGQIWAIWELGFLRGTDGSNHYGPDPLRLRAIKRENRQRMQEAALKAKPLTADEIAQGKQRVAHLSAKISELDTGTPDMNRLIDALRLFERETGKALKMSIDTVGEPPRTVLRRSEGQTSHNLIVKDGVYIDWIATGPDQYDTRYETLCEAVFEFAADSRTSMWAQEFRRKIGVPKQL